MLYNKYLKSIVKNKYLSYNIYIRKNKELYYG